MQLVNDVAPSKLQVVVRDQVIEIPGPEDIVIDHGASIALVESQQRMSVSGKLLAVENMPGGSIFPLDLTATPPATRCSPIKLRLPSPSTRAAAAFGQAQTANAACL